MPQDLPFHEQPLYNLEIMGSYMCVSRGSRSGRLATHRVQYRLCFIFHFDVLRV
jgi:hypothetical protein